MLIDYEVGDFAEGEALLERHLEAMRGTPSMASSEYVAPIMTIPMITRITGIVDHRADIAKEAGEAHLSATGVHVQAWIP